jgi:hypothetical protein
MYRWPTLFNHPVITGTGDNHFVGQANIEGPGYRRQVGRDWLDHAKAALGAGLAGQPLQGRLIKGCVRRPNCVNRCLKYLHESLLE